jgi:hypothetical protein
MTDALQALGQIAGIAGLSVGAALFVFRDIIRKQIFTTLTSIASYRLMRLLIVAAWSIAIVGILVGYWPNIVAMQIGTVASQQNIGIRN